MTGFYCKCKKCGNKAEVDMSNGTCLTCKPPIYLYNYKCSKCGEIGSANQEDIYGELTLNTDPLPDTHLYRTCLICGQLVETNKTYGEVVCDDCKDTIKWFKEQKQNWIKAFELTKAQEEVSKMTIYSKPFWCDQPCPCAECNKAVECIRMYNEEHDKVDFSSIKETKDK